MDKIQSLVDWTAVHATVEKPPIVASVLRGELAAKTLPFFLALHLYFAPSDFWQSCMHTALILLMKMLLLVGRVG